MAAVLGGVLLIYCGLLFYLLYGITKISSLHGRGRPWIGFSVVIPFRNEKKHLPALLESLEALDYPRESFQVLLVDDESEDDSAVLCEEHIKKSQLDIRCIPKQTITGSPKKDAITTGVRNADFEYIVTTDGDCTVPQSWLQEFSSTILATGAKMVSAPLICSPGIGFLNVFEAIDVLSLQSATIGGFGLRRPFLCNGANLCYSREAFWKVGAYGGNSSFTSGDDVFLLKAFRKNQLLAVFRRSRRAVVTTAPQPDLNSLMQQRLRWVSKASASTEPLSMITAGIVLLMNLFLVGGLFGVALSALDWKIVLLAFVGKGLTDLVFIYPSANLVFQKHLLKHYIWCGVLYPFFSCAIGLAAFFMSYTWKGRSFKK